ncbi:GntR family transcriptional regulator [Oceaniovalibus sp. ACAM 378]|uniref:GntR family transcriptional regulator n=1 Tax=Oceaniovalibus sp. ACAM 378 TaxID=2599923 RepID=UPI0011D897E9|nr:GntR family transcriptional regulator [Oceaniovalibus sp. ACAM 378]TYB84034.1 GntR family transcriptional regulator [Oceaniovalibus sp. ACAM 378]
MTTQLDKLYESLRADILNLVLSPGLRLSERMIEARYRGPSRTPIRAAMLRLEANRLVQKVDRVWSVTPLSLTHIMQACEFRIGIEREGVTLACERAQPRKLEQIEAELVPSDTDASRKDWLHSGCEFHVELMRLSGNELYVEAMQDVMQRLARIRWLEVVNEAGRARTIIEHREILRHLRAGDAAAARDAVTRHALETQQRHQDTLAKSVMRTGSLVIGGSNYDQP